MKRIILEFHNWRMMAPDDDNELVALFHFCLMPEELRKSGKKPEHTDCFWTEVPLQRFLVERPGWQKLAKGDKVKVMFRHAEEQIREAKRKLRQAPLFWTTKSKHRNGPAWDPATIQFPKAPAVVFDAEEETTAPRFAARKGAGLVSS